jgi:phosphatidylglycerol---prolipoprotein diacylglyceryl transferase
MLPVLYRFPDWIPLLGEQPITTFGVALLLASLLAGTLFRRRLPDLDGGQAWTLVLSAVLGGLVVAKLSHLAVHGVLGIPGAGFGRAGLNGIGGVVGGGAALFWQARRTGVSLPAVAAAAASPLLLGYAVVRLGSFLAGGEYGVPTSMPWGVAFPAGTPPTTPANLLATFGLESPPGARVGDFVRVHPTQLYEATLAVMGLVALEAGRRRGVGGWRLFGWSIILYGATRLPVDLLRAKQDHLVGPVTMDAVLALALVAVGAALIARAGGKRPVMAP